MASHLGLWLPRIRQLSLYLSISYGRKVVPIGFVEFASTPVSCPDSFWNIFSRSGRGDVIEEVRGCIPFSVRRYRLLVWLFDVRMDADCRGASPVSWTRQISCDNRLDKISLKRLTFFSPPEPLDSPSPGIDSLVVLQAPLAGSTAIDRCSPVFYSVERQTKVWKKCYSRWRCSKGCCHRFCRQLGQKDV